MVISPNVMKRTFKFIRVFFVLLGAISPVFAQLADKIKPQAMPFRLNEVKLLESPFSRARDLNAEVLLKINADRLLHNFRENAGLKPKGEKYGGWEKMGIAGHSLGHYLSALALHYGSTGDKRFLERVNYIVDELEACQTANGDGYLAAIPDGRRVFADLSAGKITHKNPFDLNGNWVPWYNMHKTFAGLLDTDEYTGNKKALRIAVKLADWVDKTTATLTDAQVQDMLYVEQGGMLESLVELSARTGDQKYIALAERSFYHKAMMDPLSKGNGLVLEKVHANMQVPKVIGAARLYEVAAKLEAERIAETFWTEVIDHHTYVNGGNTDKEHFGKRDQLSARMSGSMTETCNTYNMLKLTRHLFEWAPEAEYFDYYERALYNQILASQDPKTGQYTYKVGLYGGYFQSFSTLEDSFWCCTGSGFENHTKYNDSIYFHGADDLYVNLFIPSTVTWKEKGLTLKQESSFPDSDKTLLTVTGVKTAPVTLKIRRPAWAEMGVTVKVNGKPFAFEDKAGSYVSISRRWKRGDRIEVQFPFSLRIERTPDDPNRLAILYGPVVLAGLFGTDNFPPEGPYGREGGDDWKDLPLPKIPKLSRTERPATEWIKPVAGKSLTFQMVGAGGESITLVPLFRSQHQRMTVYWDAL